MSAAKLRPFNGESAPRRQNGQARRPCNGRQTPWEASSWPETANLSGNVRHRAPLNRNGRGGCAAANGRVPSLAWNRRGGSLALNHRARRGADPGPVGVAVSMVVAILIIPATASASAFASASSGHAAWSTPRQFCVVHVDAHRLQLCTHIIRLGEVAVTSGLLALIHEALDLALAGDLGCRPWRVALEASVSLREVHGPAILTVPIACPPLNRRWSVPSAMLARTASAATTSFRKRTAPSHRLLCKAFWAGGREAQWLHHLKHAALE
eukprot:CAMPEP_0117525358 /NCGR_PEP_ID=MMETSP0784-20121206/35727_1 /TAXON_ID=39447 /ORGANISM="" /LENGTH=267 /DNA_ID=CAMNT_0005321549 /DNA_START=85 /DNA_END=886 /DNA_ORIENTATION=-